MKNEKKNIEKILKIIIFMEFKIYKLLFIIKLYIIFII